ncbi:MAG: N-formylglutamate amidohydrolase [Casimicrobiaceae bacterium]
MTPTTRSTRPPTMLLVTCEHGGYDIPPQYRQVFAGWDDMLRSHRGHDPGALVLARDFAAFYGAPLIASTVSRLLVELNRSAHHRKIFSERTRALPEAEKACILAAYYTPYRRSVEDHVADAVAAGARVLHVSCHTFTPVLDGSERNTDVGLLYDPRRSGERGLCEAWSRALGARIAPLRVRRNYPYRGYDDGLTTSLRRKFPDDAYLGVEIEVNQKHALARNGTFATIRDALVHTLGALPDAPFRPATATCGANPATAERRRTAQA